MGIVRYLKVIDVKRWCVL